MRETIWRGFLPEASRAGTAPPVSQPASVGLLPRLDPRSLEVVVSESPDPHPAWAELEATGLLTPFQTRAWLLPWYRIIGQAYGAEPLIATVRERATGRPLVVFPLACRREGRLRVVEFPDLGVSDYNAPILAAGFSPRPDEVAAIMRLLRRALAGADLVRFDKVPLAIQGRVNPFASEARSRRLGYGAWAAALPGDVATYDADLAPTFRKELKRKSARLSHRGAVTFGFAASEAEARTIFSALRRQRHERFDALDRNDALGRDTFRRFYEAVALDDWPRSILSLAALRVDGEIVATMLALTHGTTYYLVMSAFEAGPWKSCSPGNIAMHRAVAALIGQGFTSFDLTIGDEPYKRQFGAVEQALSGASYALTLGGAPHALGGHLRSALKPVLRGVSARLRL